MATIPSGTKFLGVDPALTNLTEKKGSRLDSKTEYFSIEDLTSAVGPGPAGPQGVQGPAGPVGPVGPAGLEWQGAWVSGTSYVADDAVGYDGASWFCILATSGTTAPDADPTHWALLASQGAQGIQGVQGPTGPQGPAGSSSTRTKGTVSGGTTVSPAILQYNNNLIFQGGNNYFILPDTTVPGVEVIIDSACNAQASVFAYGTGGFEVQYNSSTSQLTVNLNEVYRLTSLGGNYWLIEAVQRSQVKLNGRYLGDGGFNYTLIVNNTTTSALTASQLNTSYPNTFTLTGVMVCCKDIVGGGLAYVKTGTNTWISLPLTAVS